MKFFDRKWPALLLWPLSFLYGAVVTLRNIFYDIGLFKSHSVDAYVISIGNVTVGGTGKTPTVQYLANKFIALDKRVAIISRGYGRQSKGTVIVSDGVDVLGAVEDAGDEPFLLAQSCSGAVVIVDSDRVRAAQLAVQKFQPDVILLDDAFQHRRIHRDVDLLTFRMNHPVGNGFCLPAGPLREPIRNVKRAHIVLMNGEKNIDSQELSSKSVPQFFANYIPKSLKNKMDDTLPLELDGKKVVAFCGLANPQNFRMTIEKLNMNLLDFIAFKDHCKFDSDDMVRIKKMYDMSLADIIVTTEKDWVKLPLDLLDEHWYRLQIEIKPCEENKILSLFEILK